MRKTRALADVAEEAADRAMREVVLPLRELRASGDHVTDAVVADIVRRREHEG